MLLPDLKELLSATHAIVIDATNISALTPHKVRELLEEQFSLEKGTLDAAEFKKPIKKAIKEALESRKQERTRKEIVSPEDEDESKPSPKRKRETSKKQFKSASVVATSDIEEDYPLPPPAPKPAQTALALSSAPKSKVDTSKASSSFGNTKPSSSNLLSDEEGQHNSDVESNTTFKSSKKGKGKVKSAANIADSDDDGVSEEPPKKRQKGQSTHKSSEKAATKPKRAKKIEDKDEATIKKLKSYVVACGVRKPWARLFEGVDSPKAQINIIKKILTELGMDGRMSLDQAKRIRAQRELKADLEAVQSFEKSALVRGRRRGENVPVKDDKKTSDEENEEVLETDKPTKRKTARQSIMAFLGSDNDSD